MIVEIYSHPQQEMLAADCANYGVLGAIAPFLIFQQPCLFLSYLFEFIFTDDVLPTSWIINFTVSHFV